MKKNIPWPPIIRTAKVPLLIRLRDLLLTILAWVIVATLLWELFDFLEDYFSDPIFTIRRIHALDWGTFIQRASVFTMIGTVLLVWLLFRGLSRRKHLKHHKTKKKVKPLSLSEHGKDFGVSEQSIEDWRRNKIAVVYFDANSKIERIEARPKPGA